MQKQTLIIGVVIAVVVLGVLAWFLANKSTDTLITPGEPIVFVAEDGAPVVVSFDAEGGTALLHSGLGYTNVRLTQTAAASGARYENTELGLVVWNKGNEVTVYVNDEPVAEAMRVAEQKVLEGTVAYRERIALPEGSVITVSLNDVSRADAPADTIASQTITTNGENVPIAFALAYSPAAIESTHTYALSARITVHGQLRWITTDHVAVLTNNAPRTNVDLLLEGVSSGTGSVRPEPVVDVVDGKSFRLASVDGEVVEGEYPLSFDDGHVSAKFCNSMAGGYTLLNTRVQGTLASTLMFCTGPSMEYEQLFGSLMNDGAQVAYVGNTLTLTGVEGTMTFTEVE